MSTYTGPGARAHGPAQRGGTQRGGAWDKHTQPPKASGEFAAPGQAGMKAVAAGLIGSAALVLPAAATWASPGSAALATMPTGSAVYTAADILGPGAQFHAYTVGSPAHHGGGQANAARTSSAPVNATLTADVTQTDTPLYTATAQSTAVRSAQPTATIGQGTPAASATGSAYGARATQPSAAPGPVSVGAANSGGTAAAQPAPAVHHYFYGADWRPSERLPWPPQSDQGGAWQASAWQGGTGGDYQRYSGDQRHSGERRIPRDQGTPVTSGQTGSGATTPGGAYQPGNGSGTPGSATPPPAPPIVTTGDGTTPVTVWPMIPYPPNVYWEAAGTGTTAGAGASSTTAGWSSTAGNTATVPTGGTTATGTTTTTTGATSGTGGTATSGTATSGTAGNTTSGTEVPVFNTSGSQVGVAVVNPATGAVELVGPGGAVLGIVQQQNGAVNLIGAGGAVLGNFAVNQANGTVIFTTVGGAASSGNTSPTGGISG
jgi:hypothetical protein